MASFGVLKFCVCLVTFMWIIFHIDAISSKDDHTLECKLELKDTGFDSKRIDALKIIEDLRLTGTCRCYDINMTEREQAVKDADLIQQTSKPQQIEINLKNIVNEMKNTISLQHNEMNELSTANFEMKTFIAQQQDKLDKTNAIVNKMSSTINWMIDILPVCKEPASLNNGIVIGNSTSEGLIAVYGCEDNYGLEGKQTRKCLPTKEWEGESPVCVPVYGPPLRAAMYVGARVQRGRDWYKRDGPGLGTVLRVATDDTVKVDWDRSSWHSWHRLGAQYKYDIMFVPGTYDSSKAGQGQQQL